MGRNLRNPQPLSLKPEDIGFGLSQIKLPSIKSLTQIISLLTTDGTGVGTRRFCNAVNKSTNAASNYEQIEQKRSPILSNQIDLQQERVLVIVQPDWHHGVISIICLPLSGSLWRSVFIGTYEDEQHIHGSARAFRISLYLRL